MSKRSAGELLADESRALAICQNLRSATDEDIAYLKRYARQLGFPTAAGLCNSLGVDGPSRKRARGYVERNEEEEANEQVPAFEYWPLLPAEGRAHIILQTFLADPRSVLRLCQIDADANALCRAPLVDLKPVGCGLSLNILQAARLAIEIGSTDPLQLCVAHAERCWLYALLDFTIRFSGRFNCKNGGNTELCLSGQQTIGLPGEEYGRTWELWSLLQARGVGFEENDAYIPLDELATWFFEPDVQPTLRTYGNGLREWADDPNFPTLSARLGGLILPNLSHVQDVSTLLRFTSTWHALPLWGNDINPNDKVYQIAAEIPATLFLAEFTDRYDLLQGLTKQTWPEIFEALNGPELRVRFQIWLERALRNYLPPTCQGTAIGFFELFQGDFFLAFGTDWRFAKTIDIHGRILPGHRRFVA